LVRVMVVKATFNNISVISWWSVSRRTRAGKIQIDCYKGVRIMVVNATFNIFSVISWRSVSLVEESGVSRENH